MREAIVLTQDEANDLLAVLGEIPIRYLGIVQEVQRRLQAKFLEPEDMEYEPGAAQRRSQDDHQQPGH